MFVFPTVFEEDITQEQQEFLENIEYEDDDIYKCWIYKGYRGPQYLGDQKTPMYRKIYKMFKGYQDKILEEELGPVKIEIRHLCSNNWCANPTHLEKVDYRVNQADSALIKKVVGYLYQNIPDFHPVGHQYNLDHYLLVKKMFRATAYRHTEEVYIMYEEFRSLSPKGKIWPTLPRKRKMR